MEDSQALTQATLINQLLIGSTIQDSIIDETKEFFGFSVITKEGKPLVVWISSDEEGNSCGALEIQEVEDPGEEDE